MIGIVDVSVQAHNPSMPLFPMRAFEGSPSSVRVRSVPKKIGNWSISKVYFSVAYPDNTTQTVECKLVGGVYVGTIAGCDTVGNVQNGYSIYADGVDENGNAVTNYCLGKGDIQILDARGITQPLQNTTFVQILSAHPTTPNDGDMWYENDVWYVWQNGQALPLGDNSAIIGNLSDRVDELSAGLSAKADVSSLNDYELKVDLSNDVSAIVTARKQNWNCTPSQYNGYDIIIKVVQDGEFVQPFANDQAIGAPIEFNQETVQDGDRFYWASPGTADINLTAAYVAEPKNALGLAFESELSAKQNALTNTQLSAIDSVVGDRTTKVKYQDGTMSSFNFVGEIDYRSIPNVSAAVEVDIGNSVSIIGNGAFNGCYSLVRVSIPDSVTHISGFAFWTCSSLVSVTIPDSVIEVGSAAFQRCFSLSSAHVGTGLAALGNDTLFSSCSSLVDVNIPHNITAINYGTFQGCYGLADVTIPDSVKSIGNSAFANCHGLTNVTIPNSVTSIGYGAFMDCTSLSSVTIPESVVTVGNIAFQNSIGLTSIVVKGKTQAEAEALLAGADVPAGCTITTWNDASQEWVESKGYALSTDVQTNLSNKQDKLSDPQISAINSVVDERATAVKYSNGDISVFNLVGTATKYDVSSQYDIVEVKFGSSVTTVGTFNGAGVLISSIDLPNSITAISDNAFSNGRRLSSIVIPESVSYIGEGAFGACTNLSSITIPNNVTTIGADAFSQNPQLTSVVFVGKTLEQVYDIESSYGTKQYPWGIADTSIISTYNAASQEWVTPRLSYSLLSSGSVQLEDRAVQHVSLELSATVFTLPQLISGKVNDFVLDVTNTYTEGGTSSAASFSLNGTIGTDFNIVVPKDESFAEMTTLEAGEMAEFYFTRTSFELGGLPTWKVVKQVVDQYTPTAI